MVVRLVRPRGGVPERLRDERAQHAGVEERRHRRPPPHAVRPEVRGVLPNARMVLVASSRKARVARAPATWRDGVTARNSHGPKKW